MKRKQVLAITPMGSTLVVENEGERGSGTVDTYVMKRFSTANWSAAEEQEACSVFDRLIDFDPPIRHHVRHHSVIVQRGHINLVISHHPQGGLQQYIAEQRAQRLAGIPGASNRHNCAVSPMDCRAWFVMAATCVLDTHQRGLIHGNCVVGNLLCTDSAMSSSEDNAPAVVLGAAHPWRHIQAHYGYLREKAPASIDCLIAPEVTKGLPHTPASDAYLLGVMLADLVLLASLWSPFAPDELSTTNPAAKAAAMGDSSFRRYVLSLLNEEPSMRPSIKELIAAIPLLDWSAAVSNAGSASPPRSAARSASSGREASPQPHSPVRNASPPRGVELFPVVHGGATAEASKLYQPDSASKRRSQSADGAAAAAGRNPPPSFSHRVEAIHTDPFDRTSAAAELPIDPMGSAPTTPILSRRPRGAASTGVGAGGAAGQGEDRMHEWQRRATESMNEIERAMARHRQAAPADGVSASYTRHQGAHHLQQHAHHQAPTATASAVGGQAAPPVVQQQAPSSRAAGADGAPAPQRSSSQGATHRGGPAAARPAASHHPNTGGAGAQTMGPQQPLSHHTLRLMTKSERMRALEEHGKQQSARAAHYEMEKERKALAIAQQKKDDEERLRQHRQHIQQIKADKRRAAFDGNVAKRAAAGAVGPQVEIFVHTPTRAGGARQWNSEGDDEVLHPSATTITSVAAKPSQAPVQTAAAPPSQEGLFFVPLERRSVRRSSEVIKGLHQDDMATLARREPSPQSPNPLDPPPPPRQHHRAPPPPPEVGEEDIEVDEDAVSSGLPASQLASPFPDDALEEAGVVRVDELANNPSDARRSNSRRSGAGSAARFSTRTSDLFSSTDDDAEGDADDAAEDRSPPKRSAVPATTTPTSSSANHGVAHPSPGMLTAALSSPSPNPMSASKLPRPDAHRAAVAVAGGAISAVQKAAMNTSASSVELSDRSANVGHQHTAPTNTSALLHGAPASYGASNRRAKNDRHADSELVSVVEWNVDLIVRQLRRYMDADVLDEALQLCRNFARGATEARTNPRANNVLMTRLAIVIGQDAMTDCAPLISQFIALDATLATAEQLRAVDPHV